MIIMKYLSNKISSDLIIHENQFNDYYLVKIILKERWNDNNSAKNYLVE